MKGGVETLFGEQNLWSLYGLPGVVLGISALSSFAANIFAAQLIGCKDNFASKDKNNWLIDSFGIIWLQMVFICLTEFPFSYKYAFQYLDKTDTSLNEGRHFSEKKCDAE